MRYVRNYQRQVALAILLTFTVAGGYGFACSQSQVSKAKREVNRAAAVLNAAAKTNHQLYLSHTITLQQRQKAAKVIFDANELVSQAVDLAEQLQPGMSGAAIIALLEQAMQVISHNQISNPQLDTALQSAVTAINTAILIARSLK